MRSKWTVALSCLVCLILASSLLAQDDEVRVVKPAENVVRLASPSVTSELDVSHWIETGEIMVTCDPAGDPNRVIPGPAPAPYPVAVVWEKGIEQLGASKDVCDGLWFINGHLLVAGKKALVLWKIRIPNPSQRLQDEFSRDLALQLWVDWNENKNWEKSERMIFEKLNVENLVRFIQGFPVTLPYLEVYYLTCFSVPKIVKFEGGRGATKYETRVWVRGALTYDDEDASPVGETLFGEYEDYQLNWFEIRTGDKTKG